MTMNRILVGVDTSHASIEALKRAAEEARRRASTLEVVYVFQPSEHLTAFPVPPEDKDDGKGLEKVRAAYSEKLGTWLDDVDVDLDDLEVEFSVLADRRPSRALVERSREADLVVVGSRGRGGFRGLMLGSVSEQVTRHAHAPVLVIRESTTQ